MGGEILESAELLDDLALSVLGIHAGEELLVIVRLFADESHDSDDANVMTMAGYLAPKSSWLPIWEAWKAVLKDPVFNVEMFHAADCANGAGLFEDWPLTKREELQRQLIAVVNDASYEILGCSASLRIPDYDRLRPRIKKFMTISPGKPVSGPLDDPWFFVLQALLIAASAAAERVAPKDPVGFVFDEHHLKGRVPVIFATLKSMPRFKDRLGGIAFADKKSMVPLQAADLLAYETFRFFNDTQLGRHQERWQHATLRSRVYGAYYWSGEKLEAFLSDAEKGAKEAIDSGRVRPNRPQTRRLKRPYRPTTTKKLRGSFIRIFRKLKRLVVWKKV